MKTLILPLSKNAFEITGTKEKMFELRHYSRWIESRLFNKDGTKKKYDRIKFCLGYSKNRQEKTYTFPDIYRVTFPHEFKFSNGLLFDIKEGDFIIYFF